MLACLKRVDSSFVTIQLLDLCSPLESPWSFSTTSSAFTVGNAVKQGVSWKQSRQGVGTERPLDHAIARNDKTRHPLAQTCPSFAKMIVLIPNGLTPIAQQKEQKETMNLTRFER